MPEPPALDPIQRRIVTLVASGWTDRRIARDLGISPSTVWRRVREAADALGVRSRAELAARATALGLVGGTPEGGEENSPPVPEGGPGPPLE